MSKEKVILHVFLRPDGDLMALVQLGGGKPRVERVLESDRDELLKRLPKPKKTAPVEQMALFDVDKFAKRQAEVL